MKEKQLQLKRQIPKDRQVMKDRKITANDRCVDRKIKTAAIFLYYGRRPASLGLSPPNVPRQIDRQIDSGQIDERDESAAAVKQIDRIIHTRQVDTRWMYIYKIYRYKTEGQIDI